MRLRGQAALVTGTACLMQYQGPMTFVSRTFRQISSVRASSFECGTGDVQPALFTSTSSRPIWPTVSSTRRLTSVSRRTSAWTATARPPRSWISRTVASALSLDFW